MATLGSSYSFSHTLGELLSSFNKYLFSTYRLPGVSARCCEDQHKWNTVSAARRLWRSLIGEMMSRDTGSARGAHSEDPYSSSRLRGTSEWDNTWEEPWRTRFLEEIGRRQPLLFHTRLWKQPLPAANVCKWQVQAMLYHNMIFPKCFSTAWSFLPVGFMRKEKYKSVSC